MNILNCNNNFYVRGGSDKIFFEHTKIMRENGHQVIPFAPNDENRLSSEWSDYFPEAIDSKNPSIWDLPKFFYNYSASSLLKNLLNKTQIDIAHLHIYYGRLTTSILKTFDSFDIPVVQTLHDYKLICPNSNMICNEEICETCNGNEFWRAWSQNCNDNSFLKTSAIVFESYLSKYMGNRSRVDHFIAVSQFLKNKLVEFGIDENKISTIHNPINADLYNPQYQPGEYLLYFGRIDKIKGIKHLIEASIQTGTELLIVGDGDEKPILEFTYQKAENIKFLGFKKGDQLDQLIKDSLCTVCPSICYDIFPTTILESFALGKAVIGSDIGGIPEMIDHGENGLLFEPGNVEQLVDHINFFKKNKSVIQKMGKKGRKKVEDEYNSKKYYDNIISVYNSL